MTNSNISNGKRIWLWLITIMFMLFNTIMVSAGPRTSIATAWGNMKTFVFTMPFWINAVILFGVMFILYQMIISKSSDSKAMMIVMIIVIIILSCALATKFTGNDNKPIYLWDGENFKTASRFLLGPTSEEAMNPCVGQDHKFWKTIIGWTPNPSCCGTGAYEIGAHNKCQQAILRINENGSGLMAFILATVLFYLLFSAFKAKLGMDQMGDKGSKYFPIILAILLGALMANSRVTKNNIVMVGGWIAVALLGSSLTKKLGSDNRSETGKDMKGFGFGLAFGFIEMIANLLGASLFGGNVDASTITAASIFWNILKGIAIGILFGFATSGKGLFTDMITRMDKKKEKELEEFVDKGNYWRAGFRWMPILGWLARKKSPKSNKESRKKLNKKLKEHIKELERIRKAQNSARFKKEILETWIAREKEIKRDIDVLNAEIEKISEKRQ